MAGKLWAGKLVLVCVDADSFGVVVLVIDENPSANDEKFAHDRSERGHGSFPFRDQVMVCVCERPLHSNGGHCTHVEHATHATIAALAHVGTGLQGCSTGADDGGDPDKMR